MLLIVDWCTVVFDLFVVAQEWIYEVFLKRETNGNCWEEWKINIKNCKLLVSFSRPFNYMLFTPLYGVRNTGCPQISTKKFPQIYSPPKNYLNFFLVVIDPLKRFLHLKMLNYAPKWHKLMPEIPNVLFSCGNSIIRDQLQILANSD
jgi:hypothetical protein